MRLLEKCKFLGSEEKKTSWKRSTCNRCVMRGNWTTCIRQVPTRSFRPFGRLDFSTRWTYVWYYVFVMLRCVTVRELPHPALFKIWVLLSQSNHELHPARPIERPERESPEYCVPWSVCCWSRDQAERGLSFFHHLASFSNDGFEVFSIGFVVVPLLVNRVFRWEKDYFLQRGLFARLKRDNAWEFCRQLVDAGSYRPTHLYISPKLFVMWLFYCNNLMMILSFYCYPLKEKIFSFLVAVK